jgi:hypothetical protein
MSRRLGFVASLAVAAVCAQTPATPTNVAVSPVATSLAARQYWTNRVEVYPTNTAVNRLAQEMLAQRGAGFALWGCESNGVFVPEGQRLEGEALADCWRKLAAGHPARVKYVAFGEQRELVLFDPQAKPVLWLTVLNFTLPAAASPYQCQASNQVVRKGARVPGYGQGRVGHLLGAWPTPVAPPGSPGTNRPSPDASPPEVKPTGRPPFKDPDRPPLDIPRSK